MTQAVNIAQGGSNNVTMRNRIINGAMAIDQRNAGASVTPSAIGYTLDRWRASFDQASKFSVQQTPSATETGYAVRVAAGFSNYLAITSTSSYTVGSGEQFTIAQRIEGLNVSDLAWGTSDAKTITLSFLVRSSLTGTFSGALQNSTQTRSYPFTYTINSANTWEQKTITIAGDTTGTWLTTNGVGINMSFCIGGNGSPLGTANTWQAADYKGATGTTNVVSTSGATFYITGVQLEKGTAATPFEQRLYGQELALCQRYYQARSGTQLSATRGYQSDVSVRLNIFLTVPMRAAPSVIATAVGWSSGPSLSSITDYVFASGNSSSEAYLTAYTATAEL